MTHRLLGGDNLAGILAHKLARAQVPRAPEAPATLLACRESQAQRKQNILPCRLTCQESARFHEAPAAAGLAPCSVWSCEGLASPQLLAELCQTLILQKPPFISPGRERAVGQNLSGREG